MPKMCQSSKRKTPDDIFYFIDSKLVKFLFGN